MGFQTPMNFSKCYFLNFKQFNIKESESVLNTLKKIFTKSGPTHYKKVEHHGEKDSHDHKWINKIEGLISDDQDQFSGDIPEDEKELLGNLLNLRDLDAQDVMIPRVDIIGVPHDIKAEDLLFMIAHSKLNKLPVYNETLDDVLGIITLHDLFVWHLSGSPFNLKSLLKPVLFVSPSMRSLDLLFKMRERGTQMAFVVDEFGGVDGLVCFSDIIEEIIGEIQHTSSDNNRLKLFKRADGVIIADARVHLEEFRERFGIDLSNDIEEDDEVETIGGLIAFLEGRVPAPTEIIKHPRGIEFEILDADPRKVKRVSIRIPDELTRATSN